MPITPKSTLFAGFIPPRVIGETFLGLTDTYGSFNAKRIPFVNAGATALEDSADLIFAGTLLGIGGTAIGTGSLGLNTGELTVVDGDILGRIDFQAPLEASGGDAILVGASIWAEAEGTFAADNNATSLVFGTGASETAAEKMRLTSAGALGLGISVPTRFMHVSIDSDATSNVGIFLENTNPSGQIMYQIRQTGDSGSTFSWGVHQSDPGVLRLINATAFGAGDLARISASGFDIPANFRHLGNTNTKVAFTTDKIGFFAGNVNLMNLTESTQDIIELGPGSSDVDVDWDDSTGTRRWFLEGATGLMNILGGVKWPNRLTTTSTSILINDNWMYADTAAGTVIYALPGASTVGLGWSCVVIDASGNASGNTITINRAGSDTINGATSKTITTDFQAIRFRTVSSVAWQATRETVA